MLEAKRLRRVTGAERGEGPRHAGGLHTESNRLLGERVADLTQKDDVLRGICRSLFLTGSASEIVERLEKRREETGISYITIQGSDLETLERFAEGVVAPLTGR